MANPPPGVHGAGFGGPAYTPANDSGKAFTLPNLNGSPPGGMKPRRAPYGKNHRKGTPHAAGDAQHGGAPVGGQAHIRIPRRGCRCQHANRFHKCTADCVAKLQCDASCGFPGNRVSKSAEKYLRKEQGEVAGTPERDGAQLDVQAPKESMPQATAVAKVPEQPVQLIAMMPQAGMFTAGVGNVATVPRPNGDVHYVAVPVNHLPHYPLQQAAGMQLAGLPGMQPLQTVYSAVPMPVMQTVPGLTQGSFMMNVNGTIQAVQLARPPVQAMSLTQ